MADYRDRSIHWSPWGVFFLFPISISFVVTGIWILLLRGQELASYLFGWFILALGIPNSVFVAISRIVILTAEGFRIPPKKEVHWNVVQWAEIVTVTSLIIPTYVVAVVGKEREADGQLRRYVLLGTASYFKKGRLSRLVDQLNDRIALANPNETIDPWLRRTDRSDNR
jgi:hypothetical protein